jgi:hypothetical protein
MTSINNFCNTKAVVHSIRVWIVVVAMAVATVHSIVVDTLRQKHELPSVFSRFLSHPSIPSSDFYQSPTPKVNATPGVSREITTRGDTSRGAATFIAFAVLILFGVLFSFILCQFQGRQCKTPSCGTVKNVPPDDKAYNVPTDRTETHHSMECNTNDSVDSILERAASMPQNLDPDPSRKVVITAAKENDDDVSTGSDSSTDNLDGSWNGAVEATNIAVRISDGTEESRQDDRNEIYGPIDLDSGCNVKESGLPLTSSRSISRSHMHLSYQRKISKRKKKKITSSYTRPSPPIIVQGLRDIQAQHESFGRLCPIPEIAFGDDDSISLSTNRSCPRVDRPPQNDHQDDREHRVKRLMYV